MSRVGHFLLVNVLKNSCVTVDNINVTSHRMFIDTASLVIKDFMAKTKTHLPRPRLFKAKDTKLFQGQLQRQTEIRIATTDKIVGRNSNY